jgi:hypothetical protein
MAATGYGSLKEDLLSMVSAAFGRSYEQEPQSRIPTLDEVSEKLKQNLVSDKKALAIHTELMQLETELKSCVNAALAGPSAEKSEEFKKCLTELLQIETESLDWIRADKLHNVAITADPDSPEQEFYRDIAISESALSKVMNDGRKKWNYTATAGQPNDEPVMHWAAQKRALLSVRHQEMERKLSYITTYFIQFFHENRSTAEEKWLKELQKQFAEKPKFLDQCAHELSMVYQHENRLKESTLFKNSIGALPRVVGEADEDISVPLETLYLHISECTCINTFGLWQAVWAEADAKGLDYQGFSMDGHQTLKGHKEEFTTIRVQSAHQAQLEEIVFRCLSNSIPKDHSAGKILLQRNGEITSYSRP